MCTRFRQTVHEVSAAVAGKQLDKMLQLRSRGYGDRGEALKRLARQYRLPFGSLENLLKSRVKGIDADLRDRIRWAYLDTLERKVTKLQQELAVERAKGTLDDDLSQMESEALALGDRLAAAKAAIGADQ